MSEGGSGRWIAGPRKSGVVLGMLLLVLAGLAATRFANPTKRLLNEDGFVETAQAILWMESAALGLSLCWICRARQRWFVMWLGVMAALAAVREFDVHRRLNPKYLGEWGVHYRLDWWFDGTAPIKVKVVWAGAAAAVVALVCVPPILARPRPFRWLRQRHLASWLLVGAFVGLFLGWAIDDLLRFRVPQSFEKAEETFELFGAVSYLFAVLFWVVEPPRE